MQWRIYYGDGSTYDSTTGNPEEAPPLNVQLIIMSDTENGRRILHLWDWYYWTGIEWWGSDLHGMLDNLLHGKIVAVKQGRNVSNKTYHDLMKKATQDKDFKPKSATMPNEKPAQAWGKGKDETS